MAYTQTLVHFMYRLDEIHLYELIRLAIETDEFIPGMVSISSITGKLAIDWTISKRNYRHLLHLSLSEKLES